MNPKKGRNSRTVRPLQHDDHQLAFIVGVEGKVPSRTDFMHVTILPKNAHRGVASLTAVYDRSPRSGSGPDVHVGDPLSTNVSLA